MAWGEEYKNEGLYSGLGVDGAKDYSNVSRKQLEAWRYWGLQEGSGDYSKVALNRMGVELRNREAGDLRQTWEATEQPEIQKLGALGERDALSAFQREKAMALQQLGYNRSSGTGGSGGYDAARIALERGSQQQLGSIKRSAEMYELGQYLQYLDKEDDQRHQLNAMRQQYEYQKKLADANSASWWEGLTGIAGMALAIWQPWNKTPVSNTVPVQ